MNFLYYPVKPWVVNQPFGNPDPKYSGLGLRGHNGIDFHTYHGEPVYAAHDGTAYYEIDGNQGHGVVLRSKTPYDYNGQQVYFKTIYWHLCDSSKEPQFKSPIEGNDGIFIKAGDLIGYADNTGLSTGDHLHFGLKPQGIGESNNSWFNIEQNNGYMGAIDPNPYFNGLFAQDLHTVPKFSFDLFMGSFGAGVYQLQTRLVKEGYATYTPTGFFGPKTKISVIAYQKAKNLPQTGYVGPLTRAILNS